MKALKTESFKDRKSPTAPITQIFLFDPCDNIIIIIIVILLSIVFMHSRNRIFCCTTIYYRPLRGTIL